MTSLVFNPFTAKLDFVGTGGGGGAGSFTTLTSTGATTLATTGASVNTFGNTAPTTSVLIQGGSGGVTINSDVGNIAIGSDATAANLSFGNGSAAKSIIIGNPQNNTGVTIQAGNGGLVQIQALNAPVSILTVGNVFTVNTSGGSISLTGNTTLNGNLSLATLGNKISIATGLGAGSVGTFTLGGSATTLVNNSTVTGTSLIFLQVATLGTVTTPSSLAVTARSAGTSFRVQPSDSTDTSTVWYWIIN